MGCHVTVVTGNGERHEFDLHDADLAGMDARQAQEWLGKEFEAAGCVPTRPTARSIVSLQADAHLFNSSLSYSDVPFACSLKSGLAEYCSALALNPKAASLEGRPQLMFGEGQPAGRMVAAASKSSTILSNTACTSL